MLSFTLIHLFIATAQAMACAQDVLPTPGGLEDLLRARACIMPQIGGVGVRHDQARGEGIANDSFFVLRRPSQEQWEAELNYDFTVDPSIGAPPGMAATMRERVQRCFADASPYMRGPSGEQLRLRLHDPARPHPDGVIPPTVPIVIIANGARGDASRYASDFDCPTIIHEGLHHMGLCDEYREEGSFEAAGLCRPVTQSGSIMGNDMNDVYRQTVGQRRLCATDNDDLTGKSTHARFVLTRRGFADLLLEEPLKSFYPARCRFQQVNRATLSRTQLGQVRTARRGFTIDYWAADVSISGGEPRQLRETCQCPAGNETCESTLRSIESNLQTLYSTDGAAYRCPSGSAGEIIEASGLPSGFHVSGAEVTIVNDPSGRSLIHPAHFRRILRGSCEAQEAFSTYDTCANFAYTWSQPANLSVSCQEMPAVCRNAQQRLGIPFQSPP